jgi:hypothetical protein
VLKRFQNAGSRTIAIFRFALSGVCRLGVRVEPSPGRSRQKVVGSNVRTTRWERKPGGRQEGGRLMKAQKERRSAEASGVYVVAYLRCDLKQLVK